MVWVTDLAFTTRTKQCKPAQWRRSRALGQPRRVQADAPCKVQGASQVIPLLCLLSFFPLYSRALVYLYPVFYQVETSQRNATARRKSGANKTVWARFVFVFLLCGCRTLVQDAVLQALSHSLHERGDVCVAGDAVLEEGRLDLFGECLLPNTIFFEVIYSLLKQCVPHPRQPPGQCACSQAARGGPFEAHVPWQCRHRCWTGFG